ncbi:MAG: DEAD/DEAH box helicase, partial [Chloroflexi bacterium]
MPTFGANTRAPIFLTTKGKTRFDLLLSPIPHRRTWYQSWLEKCFSQFYPLIGSLSRDIYSWVIKVLENEGIIENRKIKNEIVWGINPSALKITKWVEQFRCIKCGHNVSVSSSEKILWNNAPCLRFHCDGYYIEQEKGVDYYKRLYATGDVQRIFAEEHTGILEREVRERIEKEFKTDGNERRPWFPNLLSCTPTLELGIDIGDLSSIILCSVPPSQANYLQRTGRAGRRDGNALTITVANARPHDLFFFSEPEEMIKGKVDPPGFFLDASAVLERQLTAFCFDCWVSSGVSEIAIPDSVGSVLNNLDLGNEERFPYTFIKFIEKNRKKLLKDFFTLFKDSLSAESKAYLQSFIEGGENQEGALSYRIMEGLFRLRKERHSLRKRVRNLTNQIKRMQEDPLKDRRYEEELKKLRREKIGLQALIKKINNQNTYNFFTDEGLLPNYAFPETGVILRSIIYRIKKDSKEDESNFESWVYEYERPAVSAIDELAPLNYFYAGKRKVFVDQINMDVSEIEQWRFCNNCSHMEKEIGEISAESCPHCGSPMWADSAQRIQMLRMRQVFATSSDRRSRITDESDDREPS